MQILGQLIVSGIAVGMIYGVIAFGHQLTFPTSKALNFGQGEALVLGSLASVPAASSHSSPTRPGAVRTCRV
jgi:branched-chain amino acid transport system permease protein